MPGLSWAQTWTWSKVPGRICSHIPAVTRCPHPCPCPAPPSAVLVPDPPPAGPWGWKFTRGLEQLPEFHCPVDPLALPCPWRSCRRLRSAFESAPTESQKSLGIPSFPTDPGSWKTRNLPRKKQECRDCPWNSRSRRIHWKTEDEWDENVGKRDLKFPGIPEFWDEKKKKKNGENSRKIPSGIRSCARFFQDLFIFKFPLDSIPVF